MAAAASSWWLYQQVEQGHGPFDGDRRHDPDAFIDAFDLSGLDARGQLQHRLWAERMQHYPDDNSTVLDAPYLELYRPDEPPWKISADNGHISANGAEVVLQGNVSLLRAAGPGTRAAEIHTGSLHAFPQREYAETDVAITYRSGGLEVNSVGMRAYLAEGRVELVSRVRATHQPTGTR